MSHVQTVQQIYADFGRGDVPAILGRLAESVEWDWGRPDSGIPWLKPRRGREQVAAFFQTLQALQFDKFEVRSLLEGPGQVAGVVEVEWTFTENGAKFRDLEVHLWTFDAEGRVKSFWHAADTLEMWRAYNAGRSVPQSVGTGVA